MVVIRNIGVLAWVYLAIGIAALVFGGGGEIQRDKKPQIAAEITRGGDKQTVDWTG